MDKTFIVIKENSDKEKYFISEFDFETKSYTKIAQAFTLRAAVVLVELANNTIENS